MRLATILFVSLLGAACNDEAAEMLLTCEGGNTEACYQDGLGAINAARPDYGVARKAFSAACMSAHHPQSCYQLGMLVRDAKGGPKDLARAYQLFDIACAPKAANAPPGVPEACVDVGRMLFLGEGTRENPEKAVVILETSCNSDPVMPRACTILGQAYAEEKGIEKKDIEKAMALHRKACEAGYADGCVNLGNLILVEQKKDPQPDAALPFKKACEIDTRKGCFELANLHRDGKWEGASDASASEYYQKTCNIDPTRGCYEAARLMEEGRVEASEGSIEYLYHLACEHGNTDACSRRNVELDKRQKEDKKK